MHCRLRLLLPSMFREVPITARIHPAEPPFSKAIEAQLTAIMNGADPLLLFTTLARDERLFLRFVRGSLLDAGNLTLRQREIVICRTVANCRSSYEWGVHMALFSREAGLSPEAQDALALEKPQHASWSPAETALIRACDQLHEEATIDDELWTCLGLHYGEVAIIEIIMLVGFYHSVSFITNALKLPDEAFAKPLPGAGDANLSDRLGSSETPSRP